MAKTDRENPADWRAALFKALKRPPELLRFEPLVVGDAWGAHFHTTPSHELLHVLEGQARIEYRNRAVEVRAGDTFVIPQGTPHRDVRASSSAYRVAYTFFRWPGADPVVHALQPEALLALPEGVKMRLRRLFQEFQDEYLGENAGALPRMEVMLLEVLLTLTRGVHGVSLQTDTAPSASARRRAQLVAAVRAHLEAHYAEPLGLESLAKLFGVSPFNLCRAFSQASGASLLETLTSIRVAQAKRLLTEGASVKEAAARVGFANGNYLAKVFRRIEGRSPSDFVARKPAPR
jgi:AraC-like DNA-binding protein